MPKGAPVAVERSGDPMTALRSAGGQAVSLRENAFLGRLQLIRDAAGHREPGSSDRGHRLRPETRAAVRQAPDSFDGASFLAPCPAASRYSAFLMHRGQRAWGGQSRGPREYN
jgi:hypothetical protein